MTKMGFWIIRKDNVGNTCYQCTECDHVQYAETVRCMYCDSEMVTSEEVQLKPCPFCGGKAHVMNMGYPHWIYCEDCGAQVHGRVIGEREGVLASVKAWNRRASDEEI